MTFTASSGENAKEVSCQAINDVMDEALEDTAELIVECEYLGFMNKNDLE